MVTDRCPCCFLEPGSELRCYERLVELAHPQSAIVQSPPAPIFLTVTAKVGAALGLSSTRFPRITLGDPRMSIDLLEERASDSELVALDKAFELENKRRANLLRARIDELNLCLASLARMRRESSSFRFLQRRRCSW